MDRPYLIQTAKNIKPVSSEAVEEYIQKQERLVSELNRIMLERPDIIELIGKKNNLEMMKDNHSNHARFILSILKLFHPEVLVETILWVFRVYRSRGFHYNYWVTQLNTWVDVLKKELTPKTFEAIYPLYHWMIIHIPIFSKLSDEQLTRFSESSSGLTCHK